MRNRIALIIVLIFMCGAGHANEWKNRWGVGGATTIYKMWGGVKDRSSLSYLMSIEGHYGVTRKLQIGADFGYGSSKPSRLGTSTIAEMGDPHRTFVLPLNVSLKATPLPDNVVKPYALLGGSLLFWDLRDVADEDGNVFTSGGFKWGHSIRNEISFGLAYGLGFEWFLKEWFAIDLQARNTHFLGRMQDNVGYDDANDKLGEFKVSALYYFGGEADRDKDGIPDKFDAAPLLPEDKDGFQDEDGAPDPDNDNDGIPDKDDLEPNAPEDKDGFQDADGAPDPDNDKDGVLDVNDAAPMLPEDIDGFEDDDGIPDFDNDKDGILDKDDDCPNQAETVNGYNDEDGCPDQAQAQTQTPSIFQREDIALVPVTFKTGSAELSKDSFRHLDRLVLNIIEFPNVVIEIRGHTDNIGTAYLNQLLSEKRAYSVRDYILSKGVESNRVTAIGFGERYPIADNTTAEGRAKNRRIEMVRVR